MRTLHMSPFRPIIHEKGIQFSSVQSISHVWLFATPLSAVCQASLSVTHSQSLLKLMSMESMMPSNHLILCHPLLLLPSIFPSIRVFPSESALHIRWPKYWSFSFSFSFSPSNEYSGLIFFRMDWFDLLAVQGTLKSLLQQHSSKASILRCSDCFVVQLSHPYMTTGKTIALTRWTFVGKLMSLLFNTLSRALGPSRRSWGSLAKENHIISFRALHSITAFVQRCAQGQVRKCCTSLGALWSQGRAAVNIYMFQKFV